VSERVFSRSFAADAEVRLFMARLGDRPAGTSIAIRTGSVSGVYNVAVAEACRRRGVGTALTWAAVGAGKAWGCDPIVLQSSTMAYSMYEAMGFRTVVPYSMFEGDSL
jgi:ribosomal protein S18 acetylase RimI-like enzyme